MQKNIYIQCFIEALYPYLHTANDRQLTALRMELYGRQLNALTSAHFMATYTTLQRVMKQQTLSNNDGSLLAVVNELLEPLHPTPGFLVAVTKGTAFMVARTHNEVANGAGSSRHAAQQPDPRVKDILEQRTKISTNSPR